MMHRVSSLWWILPVGILLALLWWRFLPWWYRAEMLPPQAAEPRPVAIVFGARVYRNGHLSAMLRDRVETAVQLYHDGRIQKIIMSGADHAFDGSEPDAMIAYAVARGVPREALQPDYGGRRTYDTCYRARKVFQVERAFLVTQAFHLPRALLTCRQLDLDVTGIIADQRAYGRRSIAWSTMREFPATLVALVDVLLERPSPVLGDPIPLEIGELKHVWL